MWHVNDTAAELYVPARLNVSADVMMRANCGGGRWNRLFNRSVMNVAIVSLAVVSLTVERSSGAKCVVPRDGSRHEVDLT